MHRCAFILLHSGLNNNLKNINTSYVQLKINQVDVKLCPFCFVKSEKSSMNDLHINPYCIINVFTDDLIYNKIL